MLKRIIDILKRDYRRDVPIYESLKDVVVIGAPHIFNASKHKREVRHLQEVVASCDYLLHEGRKETFEAMKDEDCYEALAHRDYKGQTHFLEEGGPSVRDLMEKYGMRCRPFLFYSAIGFLDEIARRSEGTAAGFRVELTDFFMNMERETGCSAGSLEQLASYTMRILFGPYEADKKICFTASNLSAEFQGHVRDYEVAGPRAKMLCTTLQGRKAILVGSGHVKLLLEHLTGAPSKPMVWGEFINLRAQRDAPSISLIEDGLLKKSFSSIIIKVKNDS